MARVKVVNIKRGFYKGTPVALYALVWAQDRLDPRTAYQVAKEKAREYEAKGYECRKDTPGHYTCIKGTDVIAVVVVWEGIEDLRAVFHKFG